jgi:uncharacterized membrane protein YpjA
VSLAPVWEFFHRFKASRAWATAFMVPNLLGIGFGYYYYWSVGQFDPSSAYFRSYGWWPFISDSPNAVVLMSVALLLYAFGRKRSRLLDALAFVSMVYVGLWTTALFLLYPEQLGTFDWGGTNNVLFFSHLGMPLEALLLVRDLLADIRSLPLAAGVAVWNLLNLWLDYGPLDLHPAPFIDDHGPIHAVSPVLMAVALACYALIVWRQRERSPRAGPPPS